MEFWVIRKMYVFVKWTIYFRYSLSTKMTAALRKQLALVITALPVRDGQ